MGYRPPPRVPADASTAAGTGDAASAAQGPAPPALKVEMSDRIIVMRDCTLEISESYASYLINALSYIFADVLKEYACRKILEHLDENIGPLIANLNLVLGACVPQMAKLGF